MYPSDAGVHHTPGTRPMIEPATREGQYSRGRILAIWAAAAIPMAVLAWGGTAPRDPDTGQPRAKLWWWLVPLILGVGVLQFIPLQALWEAIFPFLAEPDRYSFAELVGSSERKEALEGAWQVVALFVMLGIFNTVLGEELLFRGILLPKMQGVFGRWDWVANGVLFGLYHLHQPWSILSSMVRGVFLYAWPSRRFRSAWFGIIVHSMQTIVFLVLALGLVLGLA